MSAVLDGGVAGKASPDLEALASSIGGASSPPPGSPPPASPGGAPGAPEVKPVNFHQEARDLWRTVRMLRLRWPSIGEVLNDRAIEELAALWGPILERHNIDMGHLTIYFVAGIGTVPVIGDLAFAIKKDRAAKKAGGKADTIEGAVVSSTVTPAPARPAAPPPANSSSAPPPPPPDAPPAAPPDRTRLHDRAS